MNQKGKRSMKKDDPDNNGFPKLAAPAQRALANAGIGNISQLATFREAEIKQLHGIGPNALKQLKHALKASGLSFK
jgi:hypothetical protein